MKGAMNKDFSFQFVNEFVTDDNVEFSEKVYFRGNGHENINM